jgi:putative phosphonate catabolism associated alcohol dehydrogenase
VTWPVAVSCRSCFFCDDGLPQKCEALYKYGHARGLLGGGLAEHVLLRPGTAVLRVPDGLSDRVVAPANCATATSAAVLRAAGELAGRSVLVLGAGMLGLAACAMAKAAGASVFVHDPEPACRERAAAFGASEGEPSPRGADVVLELAGVAASVRAALERVRIGGTVVLAGTVAPTPGIDLDPERIVRRMLTLRGVHNYHPRDLVTALDFLAGPGRALPFESLVGATFPLTRAEDAFTHALNHPGTRVAVLP